MKRLAVTLLAVLLLLTGCWDRKEIEDLSFVIAMGMDLEPDNSLVLTVQIGIPRGITGPQTGGGGGGGELQQPAIVHQFHSPTVFEALRDLESFTSRRISMQHLRVIVFGEEMARAGLDPFLGVLTRYREGRRTVTLMVAEGRAAEILTFKPILEKEPALSLEDLTRRAQERTARAPRMELHDFLLRYETLAQQAVLPIVRMREARPGLEGAVKEKPHLLGTAVFRGGKMVDELSPAETKTYMMLTRELDSFVESVPAPGRPEYQVVLELTERGHQVRLDLSGEHPAFRVQIRAEAELREIELARRDLVSPDGLRQLERLLSDQLTDRANALIRKLQQEHRADILGFGQHLKVRFLDWPSWERYRWPDRFPEADIEVTVQVYMRQTGMTFQPVEAQGSPR